jgi:hypothetical protein
MIEQEGRYWVGPGSVSCANGSRIIFPVCVGDTQMAEDDERADGVSENVVGDGAGPRKPKTAWLAGGSQWSWEDDTRSEKSK